ncbi:MAG: hypothetical protein ACO2PN_24230, partial [Pyrobaculum sp.]
IDGGEPRHCGRPKEVRPAPGTAHRAEQKARRQTKEPSRNPQRAPPLGAETEAEHGSISAQGPHPA